MDTTESQGRCETCNHELKCHPPFYEDVLQSRKPFELRKNDRTFSSGQTLHLREWRPLTGNYTGRSLCVPIIYLVEAYPGLEQGYCILGLGTPKAGEYTYEQAQRDVVRGIIQDALQMNPPVLSKDRSAVVGFLLRDLDGRIKAFQSEVNAALERRAAEEVK